MSLVLNRVLVVQSPQLLPGHLEIMRRVLSERLPQVEVLGASNLSELPSVRIDAVVAPAAPWLGKALDSLATVQWLHLLSSGLDGLRAQNWPYRELTLTNSRGIHARAISEYVIGAMLHFVKSFDIHLRNSLDATWHRFWLEDLTGKRVLIVGLGSVGREIAKKCRAFDMTVWGVVEDRKRHADERDIIIWRDLASVLPSIDFIVVCLPLTDKTKGLIGDDFLQLLKPGVVFVDVSRGGVVDHDSLIRTLDSGIMRGVALDVFESEPLPPDSPLWRHPRALITPHVAGTYPRYFEDAVELFAQNAIRLIRGDEPLTPVVLARGY